MCLIVEVFGRQVLAGWPHRLSSGHWPGTCARASSRQRAVAVGDFEFAAELKLRSMLVCAEG